MLEVVTAGVMSHVSEGVGLDGLWSPGRLVLELLGLLLGWLHVDLHSGLGYLMISIIDCLVGAVARPIMLLLLRMKGGGVVGARGRGDGEGLTLTVVGGHQSCHCRGHGSDRHCLCGHFRHCFLGLFGLTGIDDAVLFFVLSLHGGIPMIFNSIISSSGNQFSDFGPLVAPLLMGVVDDSVLLFSP